MIKVILLNSFQIKICNTIVGQDCLITNEGGLILIDWKRFTHITEIWSIPK